VANYWNQLEQWVFEKWELIQEIEKRELGVVFEQEVTVKVSHGVNGI
jgi:NADPH-dependent 7-cyano-7-deazaguanine reductase QueF-like protein